MNWVTSAKKAPIDCENNRCLSLAIAFANCLSRLEGVAHVLVYDINPNPKPKHQEAIYFETAPNMVFLTICRRGLQQMLEIRGRYDLANGQLGDNILTYIKSQKKYFDSQDISIIKNKRPPMSGRQMSNNRWPKSLSECKLPDKHRPPVSPQPKAEADKEGDKIMIAPVDQALGKGDFSPKFPEPVILTKNEILAYKALLSVGKIKDDTPSQLFITSLQRQIKQWAQNNAIAYNALAKGLRQLRAKGIVISLPIGSRKPKSFLVYRINFSEQVNPLPQRPARKKTFRAITRRKPSPPLTSNGQKLKEILVSIADDFEKLAGMGDVLNSISGKLRKASELLGS